MNASLVMPDITFHVPPKPHPDAQEVENRTMQWCIDFGFFRNKAEEEKVRKQELGTWFPWTSPEATDVGLLALGSQLCVWYTLVDDRLTEDLGMAGKLTELANQLLWTDRITMDPYEAYPDDTDPFHLSYRDVNQRLRGVCTPGQFVRIQRGMLRYCIASAADAAYTSRNATPKSLDYLRIRRLITAMPSLYTVLAEVAQDFEVPLHIATEPEVHALAETAIDIIGVMNDIISVPRDAHRGHTSNLPAILAAEHHCTLQEGIGLAHTWLTNEINRFTTAADHIRQRPEGNLPRLVTAMEDMIAGHLEWTRTSHRYDVGM